MRRPGMLLPCLLAVLTVHAVLFWLHYVPFSRTLWGDELTYLADAARLLEGRETAGTLLWPPLYPRFVAGLLVVGRGSLVALQLAQTALLLATALVLRDLARRLLGVGFVERWIACALLAYPVLVAFAHYLWPEILHLALFVFALWILEARRERLGWLALLGLVLGLALLTKNLLTPLLPLLLLLPGLGRPWRLGLPRVAIVLAVLLLTVAPTVLSNVERHGRWLISDSALFNVWVGLSDVSRRNFVDEVVGREFKTYVESADSPTERNRILAGKLRRRIRERGWTEQLGSQLTRQYFRLFDKDSFFTDQLVGGAIEARGAGYASRASGFAAVLRGVCYGSYALMLVAAPFGLVLCPPAKRGKLWLLLLFLAYNLGLFLLVHVKSRYRVQFLPVLLLLAGCAVQFFPWPTSPAGADARLPRGPLIAAAGVSALLLGLAFAGPWLD